MPKKYYIPGVDKVNQLVETPASMEKTDKKRFVITVVVASIASIAAVVAAVFSVLVYFQ